MSRREPRRPTHLVHASGRRAPIRWPRMASLGGKKLFGWACYDDGVTSVSTDYSPPDQAATLLHEAIHHGDPEIPEEYVGRAERALVAMWIRNPDAFDWIAHVLRFG